MKVTADDVAQLLAGSLNRLYRPDLAPAERPAANQPPVFVLYNPRKTARMIFPEAPNDA